MNRFLKIIIIILVSTTIIGQTIRFGKSSVGFIFVNDTVKGTGFVLRNPKYVVTCAHVIVDSRNTDFANDVLHKNGKIVFWDESNDLAILEFQDTVSSSPLQPLPIFDLKPGELVFYMGYDAVESNSDKLIITVNTAKIKSVGKTLFKNNVVDYFEFFGSAIPGYSGGPILNQDGFV